MSFLEKIEVFAKMSFLEKVMRFLEIPKTLFVYDRMCFYRGEYVLFRMYGTEYCFGSDSYPVKFYNLILVYRVLANHCGSSLVLETVNICT